LPAANCQSTLGPNGNITIYVPVSSVNELNPVDGRLHEVTASTMTLLEPANTHQPDPVLGFGGSYFNLIDVAQGYLFDPILAGAVSRKTQGATTFDIDLLPPAPGIECRSGGATGSFQVIVSFAVPITLTSAQVSAGTGSVSAALASGSQVFVNLTGVTNAQRIALSLTVNDGTNAHSIVVPMGVLLGDVNATGSVDGNDVSEVQGHTRQPVTTANFRDDVNVTGGIDGNDVSITQGQTRTSLP
ncbi:MAG TPA: hypothetical protein VGQ95_08950, partial [Chthoniobacterales bacterium]|nr:hypothetical protein [Chthoniobacterales bacterium]